MQPKLMDEQLADIYGTGQPESFDQEDLQKTAAAELLVKLAEEREVDLNQFSDEEIQEMVSELYGEEKTAQAPPFPPTPKEEKKKDAKDEEEEEKNKEKVAEADFLGRVMAHAYTQELGNIEKEAAKGDVTYKGHKPSAGKLDRTLGGMTVGSVKGGLGGGAAGAGLGALAGLLSKGKLSPLRGAGVGGLLGGNVGSAGGSIVGGVRGYRKAKATEKALKKQGEADGSALEALAQDRAFDMAKEAGWIDDEGQFLFDPQQEKTAEVSAVDQAVAQRALEICAEQGLPVYFE